MLDIDRFAAVNDTYGQPGGDQVLMWAARAMQQHFRPGDLIARYGGNEFCVLLPDTRLDRALTALERLRSSIEHAAITLDDGRSLTITISGGAAAWRDGWSLEDLVQGAEKALAGAKQGGRNKVMIVP
jgi:diguanylate cyclase (GGDEF)-like protein